MDKELFGNVFDNAASHLCGLKNFYPLQVLVVLYYIKKGDDVIRGKILDSMFLMTVLT